ALVIVVIAIAGRRWRRHAWEGGYGYGPGGYVHPWAQAQAARSAEATLAERFAQGDIDEVEYRARVEVLRANTPQPPRR
ncbi:MAG TPA: hypothetical protein VNT53_09050, partial [Pseudolysinimonas sp.]|nr:hypothetical protein [Pseudolysinimonas sp.]